MEQEGNAREDQVRLFAIVEVNHLFANHIRQPRLVRASRYSDGGEGEEGEDSLRSSVLISNFWFGTRSTSVLKV